MMMMMIQQWICVCMILFTMVIHGKYTNEALKDQIKKLPGLKSSYSGKMFSGYIPVDDEGKKQLFYWYVESLKDPETDPVVLWTNGGPGCSGLSGFLTEQGPFRPLNNNSLRFNEYTWNAISNMVFIEQPVGVGFSYYEEGADLQYNDAGAARDNYRFILGFFERFPHLKTHDFYLSSESYGGHYIPSLAKEIVVRGGVDNFVGFLVGNPLTYMPFRDYGQFGTYAQHQLLPKPLWDQYLENDCQHMNHTGACVGIEAEITEITKELDPYAIDFPLCLDKNHVPAGLVSRRHELGTFVRTLAAATNRPESHYFPSIYDKCEENYTEAYLNLPQVKKALHVREGHTAKWGICSKEVEDRYNKADVNREMMSFYKFLIDGGYNLKILIYSGDDDSICATLGTQQFIWYLGYDVVEKWKSWHTSDGQVAGFRVAFEGFSFQTVHGAGHMAPTTRPYQSFELFKTFIESPRGVVGKKKQDMTSPLSSIE